MMSRDQLLWEVRDIMGEVKPADLTDHELANMVALLRPIRDRLTPPT